MEGKIIISKAPVCDQVSVEEIPNHPPIIREGKQSGLLADEKSLI